MSGVNEIGGVATAFVTDPSAPLNLPDIDYSQSGFFTEDDWGELLPLIQEGNVTPLDIQDFLLENFTSTTACPYGFICDVNEMANCTKIRMVPVLFGFGDILAGTFCNSSRLQNCPVGSYCPDPTQEPIICEEGYFCPHKTAIPEIDCPQCEGGEDRLQHDYYGFVVLALVFVASLLYAMYRIIHRYRKESLNRFAALAARQMDSLKMSKLRAAQQERLEKVRPILERIAKHLPKDSTAIIFKEDGAIQYNARQLFNTLDKDQNNALDVEELQTILHLQPEQLAHLVYRMNALQNPGQAKPASSRKNTVTKSCFTSNFLDVLMEVCNFSPSPEEIHKLFDSIDTAHVGFFYAQDLYNSPVSFFLTQPQINQMIKAFARIAKKNEASRATSDREESRFSFTHMPVLQAQRSTSTFYGYSSAVVVITRPLFMEHYADILRQVSQVPVPVPSAGGPGDNETGDAKTNLTMGTVDIAFDKLSLKVKAADDKQVAVVNEVSGRCQARTMTALMGGSGAGKTSLLNALCGRAHYGDTTGKIYVNGTETRIEEHKALTGFVPQDDIVYAELTVKECLMYSARFSSPNNTGLEELEDLADATLANLGLSRVADSIVGDVNRRGVSGGEKKRVNIGVELMARPSVLFLDEPTSGLDSTSALLVMQSLKNLCHQQSVTVISVIHQPRKIIFDLFDSLILLGWGGNMVYHGPVNEAKIYFGSIPKPYFLPAGESLADWLIDISTGLIAPEDSNDVGDDHTSKTAIVQSSESATEDVAKLRRDDLFKFWRAHYGAAKGTRKRLYAAPKPFPIPTPTERPPFWNQLKIQLERNVLVTWRNKTSKLVDVCLIIIAVALSAGFEGTLQLTRQHTPAVSFTDLTNGTPAGMYTNMPQFFLHATSQKPALVQFTMKLGVIASVLLALTATRAITAKRLEFFRESASGYNVNAYFAAINITGLVEYSFQMIIAGGAAFWLRNSIAIWFGYIYNFLIIMWLTVSWSLLLPLVVPGNNVVLAAGFFMAFFSLLFSGGLPPIEYTAYIIHVPNRHVFHAEIYYDGNAFTQLFSGFFSVARFFIEGMIVQEQRCLPMQTGYTLDEDLSVSFPLELTSFSLTSLAGNDLSVVQRSCNGWYWSFLPAFFVGLTVRYLAAGLIHVSERGKQAKKSLWEELRAKPWSENPMKRSTTWFLLGFVCLFGITSALIVLERGSTGIDEHTGLLTEADQILIDATLANYIEASTS